MSTPPDDVRTDAAGPAAPPATATPAEAAAPEPVIGDRWGTLPPLERCAELDARLAEWDAMPDHGTLLGPFDGAGWPGKLTGADVYYLAARSLVGHDGNVMQSLAELHGTWVPLPDLHLERARLGNANLEHAHLEEAHLEQAHLTSAHLDYAHLLEASLDDSMLIGAHLRGAELTAAGLGRAKLLGAHLEHANLNSAVLAGAWMRGAFLDAGTDLTDAIVTDAEHGSVSVADVRWQGVNLAVVKEWPDDMVLGDEQVAWELARATLPEAEPPEAHHKAVEKQRDEAREAFRAAARAYRQLATAMRDQGMNEEADRLAYRAQVMQRKVYCRHHRWQVKYLRAGASRFLDWIAGYGYKPQRCVRAYLLVILTFAAIYFAISQRISPRLSPLAAAVFSMTSFHGRGFFPGGIGLDDPITVLAALEALCGLIIEVSLIATFTQRFFGK